MVLRRLLIYESISRAEATETDLVVVFLRAGVQPTLVPYTEAFLTDPVIFGPLFQSIEMRAHVNRITAC